VKCVFDMTSLCLLYFVVEVQKVKIEQHEHYLPETKEVLSASSTLGRELGGKLGPFCFPTEEECSETIEEGSRPLLFVLTTEDGQRLFGAAQRWRRQGNIPTAAGVLSAFPFFWNHLRLGALLSKEIEKGSSLENGVLDGGLPYPGTVQVQFSVGDGTISSTERLVPWVCEYKWMDFCFRIMFELLSDEDIALLIFTCLREEKLIFVHSDTTVLVAISQAVIALLFPFAWRHTYVPVVPDIMSDVLQCPTACIMGTTSAIFDEEYAEHAHLAENEVVRD